MTPTIYACSSFGEYFGVYVQSCKDGDRRFSFGTLARRLRLKSPSLLAMIARGDRQPTPALLHKLCEQMQLGRPERRYAEALVGLSRAKDIEEQLRWGKELRRLQPANSELILRLETLDMVAKWYAVVILEMTKLPAFRPEAGWISRHLGASVSADMVRETLDTLERQGLVVKDEDGVPRKSADVIRMGVNVPSTAIRSFHKQVLLRAHQAIDRQSVDERYFTSVTLAVPRSKVPNAGKLIAQFRDEFMATLAADDVPPDEIYHLSVQFFRATEKSP